MMMPIMDGAAMASALARINPMVRIISASGLGKGTGPAMPVGGSVKKSLPKPFTAEVLLTTVRQVLDDP
jgi:hypothetical protein